jgi:hypothetical protein
MAFHWVYWMEGQKAGMRVEHMVDQLVAHHWVDLWVVLMADY